MQNDSLAIPFLTADGTPPAIHLQAAGREPDDPDSTHFANECSIAVNVTLSEAGMGTIAALPDSTEPSGISAATVVNGTWPSLYAPLDAQTFAALPAQANQSSSVLTELPCDASIQVAAAAQDAAGNTNATVVAIRVQTPDVVPPNFVAGTPAIAASASTSVWLSIQLNEAGVAVAQVRESASKVTILGRCFDSESGDVFEFCQAVCVCVALTIVHLCMYSADI